jgi:hypothetical protein
MVLDEVFELLKAISGCTFASLDSRTEPKPGIICITTGERVMLFTNKKSSGYENMVRRRLMEAGKNPDNFVLSDLPWGIRVDDSPIIEHAGRYYLQTVVMEHGESKYYIGATEIDPAAVGIRPRRTNQGLSLGNEVIVKTFKIESITRITLLGHTFNDNTEGSGRTILRPNYSSVDTRK